MGTIDMLQEIFKEKLSEKQAAPTGLRALLTYFVWYGFLISAFCGVVFIGLSAIVGGNFLAWLAFAFGALMLGEGVAFSLTRFERYPAAAGLLAATLLISLIGLVVGAGVASAALSFYLANLLATLFATLAANFYKDNEEEKLEASAMMITIGRLENDLEIIGATVDSLEEGLLLTDAQDKVLRLNRRLATLFGFRTETNDESKTHEYNTVNEWIAQVRGVASNPEDFRASLQNAREMVRRGETSDFIFGIEKPNPRYRATEPIPPRPQLPPMLPAESGSPFGSTTPLFQQAALENEPEPLFERDNRPLLYREMKLTVFPVLGTKGQMLGICYLVRDVTEEREVEQIKENFISIVSHEVRTPMAVILGLTELLALPNIEQDEREEWLKAINQEALRLRTVLNDMQSISRIKDGALELSLEDVDLRELIDRVVKVTQLQYRSEHEVTTDFEIDQTTLYTDRGKVTQVLTNLIGNAIKYTPNNGQIKIRVGTRPNYRNQVYISVTDQGIGIPRSEQHKVFSRFFRSTNTRQKKIGGTGLGLAISQHLVKLMNGAVWFESEENQGSTFYFSLPVTDTTHPMLEDPERTSSTIFK